MSKLPQSIVLSANLNVIKKFLESTPHTKCHERFGKLYLLDHHPDVAIGYFNGKHSLPKLQEMINAGTMQFISISTARALKNELTGELLLCERAVRDESISSQFLPSAKYIHAPRRLSTKVQAQLKKMEIPFQVASTWTVDNPLQKTAEEIEHYQQEGISTMEQQIAPLFAIAHFYQVDLASLMVVDSNTSHLWDEQEESPSTLHHLHNALKAAVHTLRRS